MNISPSSTVFAQELSRQSDAEKDGEIYKMALLIEPTGRTKEIRPGNGSHWTLEELQGLVGGYIEVVRTIDGGFMVINEHGKVLDPPLELNIPATRCYVHGRKDVILGPALVVDTREELDAPAES
jgi:hypothetical protein